MRKFLGYVYAVFIIAVVSGGSSAIMIISLGAIVAMAQEKPSPELQACQMKLGNEINSGLQSSASAFAMQARISELEKELISEKAKNKPAEK